MEIRTLLQIVLRVVLLRALLCLERVQVQAEDEGRQWLAHVLAGWPFLHRAAGRRVD